MWVSLGIVNALGWWVEQTSGTNHKSPITNHLVILSSSSAADEPKDPGSSITLHGCFREFSQHSPGAITFSYTDATRTFAESNPLGSVTSVFDLAGRRSTMTVGGQTAVAYTYDNANRLTQIAQGTATTGFTYDNANRRTLLTLPNSVTQTYGYDNDSRLASILYQYGSTTLGNLAYTYDNAGRRTQMSGSYARSSAPSPVLQAVYDYANELLQWGDSGLSYDADGNMLSDGSNAFAWNARNQMMTLNGVSNFQYDGLGRRETNNASVGYLYDGVDSVQELSGTTPTANRLTGGVDEFFSRADSTGAYYPLTDALGSTIALTNGSGAVSTNYTYDAFGNTSADFSNSNSFQYTGRENDGNGLYYYRARYYDPAIGRFISEDPIEFESGDVNFYRYSYDNPINFYDPSGLTAKSNWNFFWDWALGRGPRTRNYGPNDVETQEMENSPGVNAMRDQFYKGKCKTIRKKLVYGTVQAYEDTATSPFGTPFQVGGFAGASAINNGNGTVTYIVPNTAGTHSFFLHLVPDRSSPNGWGSNIYQTFQWTEPIGGRGCGCQ
jgi:RHS repeat-associated protein